MTARVGLIGAGHIGSFHSRAVRGVIRRELVDAAYVAVADRDLSRAQRFAELAGLDAATDDPLALIARDDVNAIYVCTPTRQHREVVLAAAAVGKSVFCEKPLAIDLATAREMTAAVQAAGVVNQVGLVLRFSPILNVLRSLIADPRLGQPMAVSFRDDQFFPIQGHYDSSWRADAAEAGGGTLIEHSIHDLDLLRWLLGEPDWVRCQTRNFAGHAGIEDLAVVQLGFAEGCVATLTSVWHNVLSRPSLRHVELFFENGYFALEHDYIGPLEMHTTWGGRQTLSAEAVLARYFEVAAIDDDRRREAVRRWSLEDLSFLTAAAAGTSASPDFAEALAAHVLVDAAYRSADRGSVVALSGEATGPQTL